MPGRGSAIFLHDGTGRPTNGCVSLARGRLLSLLAAPAAGSDDHDPYCIIFICLYTLQRMATAAIIGTAGYVGQETLDRLLAHPALELVALGSDSLAGQPAAALDPRLDGSLPAFVPNAEAAASGADVLFLCLDHAEAAAFEPPADTVVVDLSGAHRLPDQRARAAWYGVAPGAWSYGLPELFDAPRPADREPRLLRDGRAARARRRSPAS